MALWTFGEVADALGVQLEGKNGAIGGVSIDTRTLQPGDLFIALSGTPSGGFSSGFAGGRDGHEFVVDAVAKGAAAVIVNRKIEGVTVPQFVVADTMLDGLWKLGAAGRARFKGKVVGLTGSAGKTTTKEMLTAALEAPITVGAAWGGGSYNNFWGVPLVLARLSPEAKAWIVEMGMNTPGEIAKLTRLAKPDVALVVNVKPVHVAGVGSVEGIRKEKLSIAEGLRPDGILVVPAELSTEGVAFGGRVIRFGEGAEVNADAGWRAEGADWKVQAEVAGQSVGFVLKEGAPHRLHNALAALATVEAVGIDVQVAAEKLGAVTALVGRGAAEEVGGVLVIDDSFNGNPASMAAALQGLKARPVKGRRLAILGDMLELGPDEVRYHEELAVECDGLDGVYAVGPLMKHLYDRLPEEQKLGWNVDPKALDIHKLKAILRPGDAVVLKGSKKMLFINDVVGRLKVALGG